MTDVDDDDPFAAALAYAALSLRVIPIPPGSKAPSLAAWQLKATTDTDQIVSWWDALFPDHGVGIVTGVDSGVWVLDVDTHGDVDGRDTLADLEATYGELPETPTVLTGGGGVHYYFAWPRGVELRNDAGRRLGPGLDVRAEGGQVVAPPSLHASGGRYRWEVEHRPAASALFAAPGTMPFAPAPEWLIELLTAESPHTGLERSVSVPADESLPGSKWAADHSWHELLESDGATFMGARRLHSDGSVYELWCRPGAAGDRVSASLGYHGSDVLKVFSTNWPGLDEGATYTRFGYFAATRHGGDFQAARAAVEALGYVADHVELSSLIAVDDNVTKLSETPQGLGVHSLVDLFTGEVPEYDWLVPGLIERGDRVIVTGDEGYGKSTLLRQIGLGAAAGINPFARRADMAKHAPISVLLVDCENSERQLRREFPKGLGPISNVESVSEHFAYAIRTEGLSLDDPKDRGSDRAWLTAAVDVMKPDLLLIGPLYKLLGGDPNAEQESRNTALFLDGLRGSGARMAIVIEAHAPHGQRRPFGWSGWKRWPEFGLHLTADAQLLPFRGGRDDDRWWPGVLRRGERERHEWLWSPAGPTVRPAAEVVDLEAEYDARVRAALLRVLHDAHVPFTASELVERVDKRKSAVLAGLRYLQDRGWFVVETVERNGRDVETFRLNPDGPAGSS